MTEPSKLLVFGSFTEDETRSLLNKTPKVTQTTNQAKVEPVYVPKLAHHDANKDVNLPLEENGKALKSEGFCKENQTMIDGSNFQKLSISENENESLKSKGVSSHDGIKTNGSIITSLAIVHDDGYRLRMDAPVLATQGILPRGLINSGNLCFVNATLQALLSCSPFVLLLRGLKDSNVKKDACPTIAAFVEFIGEFDVPNGANAKKTDVNVLKTGKSFSPKMFEVVLKKFTPEVPCSMSGRPRQEDAQEFLSFIIHQMHDELLKLEGPARLNGGNSTLVSASDDDEWETVGPKNKSAVTRTQSFVQSELSSIFGGQLRSVVKARGNKASATVQPFLLLHLEISHERIKTIEDALYLFSAPEALDGYRASAAKGEVVTAKKSLKIQTLPKVMILHLMRFGYGEKGSTKLLKPVRFPLVLVLNRDLLVSPSAEGRKYELVSTITHQGREASRGHYTADARYANGQWLRFDDSSIIPISTSKVLHDQAYVLFYKQL